MVPVLVLFHFAKNEPQVSKSLLVFLYLRQIVHRNRQPHPGTMFTKTSETTASKSRGIVLASNYDVDDNEVEKLRTENDQLKTALDQVKV